MEESIGINKYTKLYTEQLIYTILYCNAPLGPQMEFAIPYATYWFVCQK